ncbi:MAG: glutamine synthetase [bacterium]
MGNTKEEILEIIERERIGVIWLWFVDICGILKGFSITPDEVKTALTDGMGFDGSSISGFNAIEESDLVAMPDISTFSILPWDDPDYRACRMFCDIVEPKDKKPYDRDSRNILKKNLAKAADMGYTFYVGPELEFFYFKNSDGTDFLDPGGYFSAPPLDLATNLRKRTIDALNAMGIPVEYHHHEVAPSQHEIDLRYDECLRMADNCITYRYLVKEVARMNGYYASFMPKPVFGVNGSGMHTHMSLFKNGKNAFFSPDSSNNLSDVAKHFIAGVLYHAQEITAFLAQWVNSYKRLVPGYEAPVYIAWSQRNRSALIRVPYYQPGKENATRIELRCPDPACNPYIAFSVMLGAGLKGMAEKYELPDEQQKNLYHMSPLELTRIGIKSLPENLHEALHFVRKSQFIREVLGDTFVENFLEVKYKEYDEYRVQVTKWELDTYFKVL